MTMYLVAKQLCMARSLPKLVQILKIFTLIDWHTNNWCVLSSSFLFPRMALQDFGFNSGILKSGLHCIVIGILPIYTHHTSLEHTDTV